MKPIRKSMTVDSRSNHMNKMNRPLWRKSKSFLFLIISVLFFYIYPAGAETFNNTVVFGDSLSDAGNLSQAIGIGVSRFTTNPGETAVMYVADGLDLPATASSSGGNNYAWGGAGVLNNYQLGLIFSPTIQSQVNNYLKNNKVSASTLYQMWGGANDIFSIYESAPGTATARIIPVANTEVSLLNDLYHAGGKYVVVYNLPNLGETPDAKNRNLQKKYQEVVNQYNQTLDSGLATLSKNGLNIIPVNVYALLSEIMSSPSTYGIINTTNAACNTSSSLTCNTQNYTRGTEQTYLFADNVHPTTGVNKMLANVVLSEISAPGKISLLSKAPLMATKSQYNLLRKEIITDTSDGDTRVFLNGDYRHQANSTNDPFSSSSNNRFASVGGDVKLNDNLNVGALVTTSNQKTTLNDAGYTLYDHSVALYQVYHTDHLWMSAFVNAGTSNFDDVYRTIHIGPAMRTESGSAKGRHFGGGIDAGWWFDLGTSVKTGPFARLERQSIEIEGYNERGNDSSAMWFSEQRRNALVSSLGWRTQGHLLAVGLDVSPYVEMAWNHDHMADNVRPITAGLNSMSGHFTMSSAPSEKDWGVADAGVMVNLTANLHTWLQYSNEFGGNPRKGNYGASVGMEYTF
ncbi:autotransporter outer membrane beta-barrel domain-containing protein [Pectobacterium brasiliense]|uniref:autotransporter outer membrane beta-barrel domain-containing protein n=1 Tax=Pectobacterium brasiliense TaxID=180957 RepID=UPI00068C6D08|nr:autotransporter domain-containing protein [Pectobacterium brasiliense]KRF61718.1 autotransporter protein [Pectobacterium brasiliense]